MQCFSFLNGRGSAQRCTNTRTAPISITYEKVGEDVDWNNMIDVVDESVIKDLLLKKHNGILPNLVYYPDLAKKEISNHLSRPGMTGDNLEKKTNTIFDNISKYSLVARDPLAMRYYVVKHTAADDGASGGTKRKKVKKRKYNKYKSRKYKKTTKREKRRRRTQKRKKPKKKTRRR